MKQDGQVHRFGVPSSWDALRRCSEMGAVVCSFVLVTVTMLNPYAQNPPEPCLKQVASGKKNSLAYDPRDQRQMAAYWGCRLGAPAQVVGTWQRLAQVQGIIYEVSQKKIGDTQVVVLEEMQGDDHCFQFKALMNKRGVWTTVWKLPRSPARAPMQYCTLSCPAIKMKMDGTKLLLQIPTTSDPQEDQASSCRKILWIPEEYEWKGRTFEISR